jgi:hypothetical protein
MKAERRPFTILFADMAGFTAFTERAGEEAAYAVMLYKVKKDPTLAREHLGRARTIIAPIGSAQLPERIDGLLSGLNGRVGLYRTFRRRLAEMGHAANR